MSNAKNETGWTVEHFTFVRYCTNVLLFFFHYFQSLLVNLFLNEEANRER